MGTIVPRKRRDGTTGYTAQILRKQKGVIVWREAKTFDRQQAAQAWLKRRETELSAPGAVARANAPQATLGAAVDRFISESKRPLGRTQMQALNLVRKCDIMNMDCGAIQSGNIVELAQELSTPNRLPQTVGTYLANLSAVFRIAKPAWNYPLDPQAMVDAQTVLHRLGVTAHSVQRDRRPTLAELDLLMQHFASRCDNDKRASPMHRIVAFAIFSCRREDEIARQPLSDIDAVHCRMMIRKMKDPKKKQTNDTWCDLTPEALKIAQALGKESESDKLINVGASAISAAFTRACHLLGINGLHFHDLRHEGVSRLFEMGKTIPQVASVSGHRSWQNLQRYTHLRQTGDKYAGWRWLEVVTKS